MAAKDKEEAVRSFFEGVLGGRKDVRETDVLDPDCTLSAPYLFNGEISDQDGVRNVAEQIRTAFPDLNIIIDEEPKITKNGDVVTRWNGTGTHTGGSEDLEPTGASIEWWGQSVSRLSGGKIVAMWWSTISNTIDGVWSATGVDSVMEVVPEDEPLAPDEELYRKKGCSIARALVYGCRKKKNNKKKK